MVAKRILKASLVERIRTLAVDHRYPADWIAEKLEMEGYPRPNGRWSAESVRRVAAEHGIALHHYGDDSLVSRPARRRVDEPLKQGKG